MIHLETFIGFVVVIILSSPFLEDGMSNTVHCNPFLTMPYVPINYLINEGLYLLTDLFFLSVSLLFLDPTYKGDHSCFSFSL